jgi:hypothetical protein
MPTPAEIAAVVPTWSLAEAAFRCGGFGAGVFLSGLVVRRTCGLTSGLRVERWALNGLLGAASYLTTYWLLKVVVGRDAQELAEIHAARVELYHSLIITAAVFGAGWRYLPRRDPQGKLLRSVATWREAVVACLILCVAAYYLVRTVPLFDYDGRRLRMHGAAYTDKMTNMMPAASLLFDVPPDCLRFAGHKFPSHYFPHWAAADIGGQRYFDAFWFHLPPLGIAINVFALVAFGRRMFRSYAAGCTAAVLYGLLEVTAVMKPLELTPALACAALAAGNRYAVSGRRRWAAAAAIFVGVMPCYEAFHAAVLLAGLGLWGAWGVGCDLVQRRRVRRERIVFPLGAAAAALLVLQGLYLGERPVAPPQIVVNNTFGDSYRRTWLDRAGDDDAVGRWLATLYAWNRNRPAHDEAEAARPAWYQRVVGRTTYGIGCVGYVAWRFGMWALLGAARLWRRRGGWRPDEGIVAATALVGFGLPWLIDVVLSIDGRTWSSPNLYRLTEFSALLLALYGTPAIASVFRGRRWALGAYMAAAIFATIDRHAPATTFYEVPPSTLAALAYLRAHVPYDETVLHPWSDCSIRRNDHGGEAFNYKRHFTLVSNLAGRRCYFEGREDYLFWNGFIRPEEIVRRRRLREAFYANPTAEQVHEVLTAGVQWIVTDGERRLPASLADEWVEKFRSGEVRIYCRR